MKIKMVKGVYAYDIPPSITHGIEGVELIRISEDPDSYKDFAGPEAVTVLIARQGAVNDMLQKFTNIKWLQLLNSGYERVDLKLLRERNIIFTNARSVYSKTIAEDVLAKILILSRNYEIHFRNQQKCFWPDDSQLPNSNVDIYGRVLGILGAGSIGREVAIRAKAFGMHVIGYDPYVTSSSGFDRIFNKPCKLAEVLKESDFVVASLPVTEETRNIMNKESFSQMKRSAFFINVSRGDIVDETALVEALENNIIRGAFIDVCKEEPLPAGSPLWKTKNLLITPHRAAYGDKMKQRMCALIETNIHRYLAGEPLLDVVNYT
ncbi:MAG TPA: D-2-hydroxyacid dehydrogenase [Clostridiaceae bacterium]|nr:D-2-hydroxyacid dehydrogenase [Clostridiaceae bacterium]